MCVREKEGERMPQCTTNCECVSLHTVQAIMCVCVYVCVFDLWFPNQTLFCGIFFKDHQSKWFHRRLAFASHLGRCKEFPNREAAGIRLQSSGRRLQKKKKKKKKSRQNDPNAPKLAALSLNGGQFAELGLQISFTFLGWECANWKQS